MKGGAGWDMTVALPQGPEKPYGKSILAPDSAPLSGDPLTPEQVKHWIATADAWVDFMPELSWTSHLRNLGLSEAHIEQVEQAMKEEV